jgi:hypothetical protein
MKKRGSSPRNENGPSYLEENFFEAWKAHPLTKGIQIERERHFHDKVMWRFDFALPQSFTAIEIQGYGTGHASYLGLKRDYEKSNQAIAYGMVTLFFMIHDLHYKYINKTIKFILSIHEQRLAIPKFHKHVVVNPVLNKPGFLDLIRRKNEHGK